MYLRAYSQVIDLVSLLVTLFIQEYLVRKLTKEDTFLKLPMRLVWIALTLMLLCLVRNANNVFMILRYLIFTGLPAIATPPSNQFTINDGSSATFTCDALAFPEHNISWTFTNISGVVTDIVSDGNNYSIVANCSTTRFGELTVMNVDYEDRGVYTCTATNSFGFDKASANLTVHGEIKVLIMFPH